MVWSSVKWGEGLSVGRGWGPVVVLHRVKMYLVCGLMLNKKLLPLMIELVVIKNHLWVIHVWWPHKMANFVTLQPLHPQEWTIDLLFKNKRSCRHGTNFKTPYPYRFHVGINVWSLTCLLWYEFFLLFFKKIPCVVWTKQANHWNIV